jgi:hypothetical protein
MKTGQYFSLLVFIPFKGLVFSEFYTYNKGCQKLLTIGKGTVGNLEMHIFISLIPLRVDRSRYNVHLMDVFIPNSLRICKLQCLKDL